MEWLTPAAIVGLLVAVVVFPWQRSIEHKFLLKKEKRELYRQLLSKMAKAKEAINEKQFELAKQSLVEFEGLSFEADLLAADDVTAMVRRVGSYCDRLVNRLAQLHEDIGYQQRNDPESVKVTIENIRETVYKMGFVNGMISSLFVADIEETSSVLSKEHSKRKKRILNELEKCVED